MTLHFPQNPAVGDTFQGWRWDGTRWVATGASGGAIGDADDDAVYGRWDGEWEPIPIISPNPPADAPPRSLWWESSTGLVYLKFQDAWVEIGEGGTGPQGETGPQGPIGDQGPPGGFASVGNIFPANPNTGDFWWNPTTNILSVWDGDQWTEASAPGGASIHIGPDPPDDPDDGALWFDSVSLRLFVYYDDGVTKQWIETSPGGQTGPQGPRGFTGETGATGATGARGDDATSNASMGASPPATPVNGAMWFDGEAGALKVWDAALSEWVVAAAPPPPRVETTVSIYAPIMLGAVSTAQVLTAPPPVLTRIGNLVTLAYAGAARAAGIATTISMIWIPEGFQPSANVPNLPLALPSSTPATTTGVQRYVSGTNVFPDNPISDFTTNNTRWAARPAVGVAANAVVSLFMTWQTADPMPDPPIYAEAELMAVTANSALTLVGAPTLMRFGNLVMCFYNGANRATAIAATQSFAWIPEGFRPTAPVSRAINTPSTTLTVQVSTTGTNYFADDPGVNVTTANTRWVMRTTLGASAAMEFALCWQTADPMPTVDAPVTWDAPVMLQAVNGNPILLAIPVPQLTRVGNLVKCVYFGISTSQVNTPATISFAWVPEGFRPTAQISRAIPTPAHSITIGPITTGTNIFPDDPATNVTTGNTRFVMRSGTQINAGIAVDFTMYWRTADPMPPQPVRGEAPVMLDAVNGAQVLLVGQPQLTRFGNLVRCTYVGQNKATATAITISFAWIPEGFRPTAQITRTIQAPMSFVLTIGQLTTGTNVFADDPATNVTTGNTRFVMRFAASQLTANVAVQFNVYWETADPMPEGSP